MRNRFDRQLVLLHEKLIAMGALCEDAIFASIRALAEDSEAVERAAQIEREIDASEREIENLCMKLLLQQQPVARDLRAISSALKMISDMERIGDQALDIAEITPYLPHGLLEAALPIHHMAKAAAKMVTDSVDSFVKGDLSLAKQVQKDDDTVDALFAAVKKDLIAQLRQDPDSGQACLDLLMIAKYLERIGDHAVNVSEWVEYSITGVHLK
ncbi:MAG: phosphate signaling complex protein PhoU [Oscillospiraceae bacterium]|nr:phosphate signaling complex protein PhoU [Oscillospiraceae bacterium]